MNFYLNPTCFASAFSVPGVVADNYLRIAGAVQLKVLLYSIRNITQDGINPDAVAQALNIAVADVKDALRFWVDAGVFTAPEAEKSVSKIQDEPKPKTVALKTVKPTRAEVAKRGAEEREIAFLLREAQNVFGRALKQSEASTIVWLYDDEGMQAALILTLLEYAKANDRCNIGFIERTAIDWINNSVTTVADADRYLNELERKKSAWHTVEAAFGIDKRMPSKTELELSNKWVNEYRLTRELLREAYNACVDSTGKLSMPYIKKIIEAWHKAGVKNAADIADFNNNAKKPARQKSGNFSTYNMADFDKHINGGD